MAAVIFAGNFRFTSMIHYCQEMISMSPLRATAVLVVTAALGVLGAGTAMAAEGGDGTAGSPGTGVNGIPGKTHSTNGFVGASADGVNPAEPVGG